MNDGDGAFHARAGRRTASSPRTTHDGRFVTLLRRQPPALRRQRRQGDGVGEGRLSARRRRCSPTSSRRSIRRRSRRATRRGRALVARLDDELLARVERRRAADADDRRGDRARRRPRRGTSTRASSTGCRTSSALSPRVARRRSRAPLLMEGIALTGAWVDTEKGLLSLIALEMGVSSRLCAYLQAGRAGRRDGADRHADRDSRKARTCCSPAAASATPCCSRSPRRCATHGNRVHLLRRLQEGRGPVQARGDRGGDRPGDLEHRHRARRSRRPAAGRALPRQHRPGDGRLRRRASSASRSCRSTTVDRIIAIGSDRMMAAVQGGAARRAGAAPASRSTSASAASTRRCSA